MRTDRTCLCPSCAVRFPAAAACPRCGGGGLLDLREAAARERARQVLAARRPRPLWWRAGRPLAGAVGMVALMLYLCGVPVAGWMLGRRLSAHVPLLESSALPPLLAAIAAFVAGGYLLQAAGLRLERLADRCLAARGLRVAIADPPAPTGKRHRGRVRARRTVASPVGGAPCVAFGLAGRGSTGAVDDGAGVAFDVEAEGGALALVDPAAARLELGPAARARSLVPAGELLAFLEERGAQLAPGRARLAEALLREGDLVEIEGPCAMRPRPEGYRGSGWVRVYGGPVRVRALPR